MTRHMQEWGKENVRTLTIHSFSYSLNKYLSRACYVSGTAADAKDATMKKTNKNLHPHGIYI